MKQGLIFTVLIVIVAILVGCGGKVDNDYYQTFIAAPSASTPTDDAAPVPTDAGSETKSDVVETGCQPTLTVTEKDKGNDPDETSSYPAGFEDAVFLGLDFCANSCRDIVTSDVSVRLANLQSDHPLHIEDTWNFTGARLRGNYWADTISGPVNLVNEPSSLAGTARADFHNPFTVKADECVHLRFTINIAQNEAYPGSLYDNKFQASVSMVSAMGNDTATEIVHQEVIKTVLPPEQDAGAADGPDKYAAYCDPLDWDPQGAYMGCCGVFTKVSLSDLKAGDLIKADGTHSVYFYGSDGRRYLFPTTVELDSWFAPLDVTSVPMHNHHAICHSVLEVTEPELTTIPPGGNVTKRPGAYITGIGSSPIRYVVDTHQTLREASPQILEQIYPGTVMARTYLTADSFFSSYNLGSQIVSPDNYIWLLKSPLADLEIELGIKP
jgi:hypothetical protein